MLLHTSDRAIRGKDALAPIRAVRGPIRAPSGKPGTLPRQESHRHLYWAIWILGAVVVSRPSHWCQRYGALTLFSGADRATSCSIAGGLGFSKQAWEMLLIVDAFSSLAFEELGIASTSPL